MKISLFLLLFLFTVLLQLAQNEWFGSDSPFEFSLIALFLIIRSSQPTRALILVFSLTLGMDIFLHANHIKGLSCLGLLPLVYLGSQIKNWVIPTFADLALFGYFVLFYLFQYYINGLLLVIFGQFFEPISFFRLLYLDLWHTMVLGIFLYFQIRYGKQS